MTKQDTLLASRWPRAVGRQIHIVVSIAFIFGLAYILGQTILSGPLQGDESGLHLAYVEWLNRFFPEIPNWHPQEGGGVSLAHGTPILAHLMVVVTHRLSGLSLTQAYHLLSFLPFPLTALGIYFLAWSVSRRQTVGLVAAVLYLLAPVTWTWIYDVGSFPQGVAVVFLPLALTCLDRYLTHYVTPSDSGFRRVWFVGLVISIAGASLTDPRVGTATALAVIVYAFLRSLLASFAKAEAHLIRPIWATLAAGLVSLLVLAFYLVPLYRYGQAANRGGLAAFSLDQLHMPTILQFIGLAPLDLGQAIASVQFPLAVALLFLVGTLVAFLYSHEASALYATGIVGLVIVLLPPMQALLNWISPAVATLLGAPSWLLVLTILLPVGAASGAWASAWALLHPRAYHSRTSVKQRRRARSRSSLRSKLAPTFSVALAAMAMVGLGIVTAAAPDHAPYGPLPGGVDLGDVWDRGGEVVGESLLAQLAPEHWPGFAIAEEAALLVKSQPLISFLPEKYPLRFDTSPHLGAVEIGTPADLNVSQVSTQNARLSLIPGGWEYQKNVFYSHDLGIDEYGNPWSLNNVAEWFGIEYVFLDPQQDRLETYEAAGWELVHGEEAFQLWRYPGSVELASLSTRPAILVTDKPGRDIYMTVFRLANDGLLPYEEVLLVEGRQRIDQYTLEDLQPFDAIFLVGYDYRNREKAWETLATYVKQGGSLFVDTGWQFTVAEWQFDQAPEVLPVSRLTWTDYGMTDEYSLDFIDIAGELDVGLFKPLVWEGQAWQLSGAQPEEVRDWGRVILSANGRPLIVAGEYGEGRVVWSGMNLINHAMYLGQNEEEILLLNNLLAWMIAGRQRQELAPPSVERSRPDQVSLAFGPASDNNTWLYWREAYFPNWHAYLNDGINRRELPIYRGGPGFMAIPVESVSKHVTLSLEWQPSAIERVAVGTSVIGVMILVALFLDGLLLGGNGFTWLKIAIVVHVPSPFLGEGSNREWAERKRAELEAGELHPQPRIYQPSEAIRWMHDKEIGVSAAGATPPASDGSEDGSIEIEVPIAEKDGTLLQSWLDSTGHSDDAWAKKLIGKRQSSEKD